MIVFGAIGLIVAGLFLMVRAVSAWPGQGEAARTTAVITTSASTAEATAIETSNVVASTTGGASAAPPDPSTSVALTPVPTLPMLTVEIAAGAPPALLAALDVFEMEGVHVVTDASDAVALRIDADAGAEDAQAIYTVSFAAATRFDTVEPAIGWEALQALWSGAPLTATTPLSEPAPITAPFTTVAVLTDTLPLLAQVLGEPSAAVVGYADAPALVEAAWQDRATMVIIPFDQLEPRLAVLAIDGQNPVENSAHFDPALYPLVASLYAHVEAAGVEEAARVRQLLGSLPPGNRDPAQLTVLTMTGVTAMCRTTAAQMERFGPAWPAEVVGAELSSADITHISNEVPFVEDCVVNTDPNNFNFCSKPDYIETLLASGVDIIGMTGNHQNDFGRQNAMTSLEMYDEWGLPYYGGGKDLQEAFTPLFMEHNGNRLAFLGANSYGPQMAWATDSLPGAAPFDLNILSATIRSIKEKDLADLVLVELQYQESYEAAPLADQRIDFNALVRAGADIVTGVQSHVPQGMEFTDGKLVLFGLGNLYFDQMWAQATREGIVAKHTFYNGRHISTQLLTTLLYDFGQPRWTTPQERESILERVFDASYW
jgi:poly-gamma-glutamate synthesis protein (capsule biosynthesis protein)